MSELAVDHTPLVARFLSSLSFFLEIRLVPYRRPVHGYPNLVEQSLS